MSHLNVKVNDDECCICLDSVSARGKRFIVSPGCCGKWYHQKCMKSLIAYEKLFCPACREPFPEEEDNNNEDNAELRRVQNALREIAAVQRRIWPSIALWDDHHHDIRINGNGPHINNDIENEEMIPDWFWNPERIGEDDINLVIDQAHCSREEAIQALLNNNHDLVNAIMELTM